MEADKIKKGRTLDDVCIHRILDKYRFYYHEIDPEDWESLLIAESLKCAKFKIRKGRVLVRTW